MPTIVVSASRPIATGARIAAIVVIVIGSVAAVVHRAVPPHETIAPPAANAGAAVDDGRASFDYLPAHFPPPAGPPSEPIATF